MKMPKTWNLFKAARDSATKEEKTEQAPETAKIIFSIEDGHTNIEFKWNTKKEEEMSVLIGCMLGEICSGGYMNDILDILKEIAETRPESQNFVKDVVAAWQTYTDYTGELIDEPVMNPLRTFGASRFFQ